MNVLEQLRDALLCNSRPTAAGLCAPRGGCGHSHLSLALVLKLLRVWVPDGRKETQKWEGSDRTPLSSCMLRCCENDLCAGLPPRPEKGGEEGRGPACQDRPALRALPPERLLFCPLWSVSEAAGCEGAPPSWRACFRKFHKRFPPPGIGTGHRLAPL